RLDPVVPREAVDSPRLDADRLTLPGDSNATRGRRVQAQSSLPALRDRVLSTDTATRARGLRPAVRVCRRTPAIEAAVDELLGRERWVELTGGGEVGAEFGKDRHLVRAAVAAEVNVELRVLPPAL